MSGHRFIADNANDDESTPLVLDLRRNVLVVPCKTDEQAERVAAFLNAELPSVR